MLKNKSIFYVKKKLIMVQILGDKTAIFERSVIVPDTAIVRIPPVRCVSRDFTKEKVL